MKSSRRLAPHPVMTSSPRSRRPLAVALFASLAVGIPFAYVLSQSGSGRVEPDAISAAGAGRCVLVANTALPRGAKREPQEDEARGLRLDFNPGDVVTYRFSQQRTVRMEEIDLAKLGAADAGPQTVELGLSQAGLLTARVYEEDRAGWTIGFEASEIAMRVEAPAAEGEAQPQALPEGGMAGEVLAAVDHSGRIEKIVFPPTVEGQGRRYWKDLLSRWQVVYPEDPAAREWTTTEDDTTGRYAARYGCAMDGRDIVVTKVKEAYTTLRLSKGIEGGEGAQVAGETTIRLERYPTHLRGEERVEIEHDALFSKVSSEVRFAFDVVRQETQAVPAAGRRQDLAAAGATTIGAPEAAPRGIGGDDAVDIAEELREIERILAAGGLEADGVSLHMDRLTELLAKDPKAVEAVMERLAEKSCSDDLAAFLTGALGGAGSEACQEGLARILTESRWLENRRHMALFSLAMVESPTGDMEATLRRVHEQGGPLAANAARMLGAFGNKVAAGDPGRYEQIGDFLTMLAGNPDQPVADRVAMLQALGNLGPKALPDAVVAAYRDEDAAIRRAAVQAVTRTNDDAANGMLVEAIRNDPDELVRLAAIDALVDGEREGASELLSRVAIEDGSDEIRQQALYALARTPADEAGVWETIEQLAASDPSETIRAAAKDILTQKETASDR